MLMQYRMQEVKDKQSRAQIELSRSLAGKPDRRSQTQPLVYSAS